MSANDAVPLTDRISVTPSEASRLTGISKRAIQAAYLSGELPAHYRTPRRPTILVSDLHAWIAAAPTQRASA